MRTGKLLAKIMIFVTVVAGTTLVGATGAQAYPSGCSSSVFLDGGYSRCTGGTGWHKIEIECEGFPFRVYWRSGPWDATPGYSYAWCDNIWPIATTTGRYRLYRSN
jgi:hypothetical protein